ncbi:MAG: DsbC family protein [Halieaceae bacterium]|nr:DsbC family protein [Halieaceae bacterium]
MNSLRKILTVALLALAGHAFPATDEETIRGKLLQARPDFEITSITPSAAAGIYEVRLGPGQMIYSTADGKYFFLGDLFSVETSGLVNLAEQQRDEQRKELLAAIDPSEMIIFSPEKGAKASITVFTDVDCFYCQKLHREVPEMNAMGIEVRYLAYPRSGIGGESYRKIASAWCADDPHAAITRLKNLETIAENVCSGNPVAEQFALGQRMGVRGTPALVLEAGQMLPGYLPATEIAQRLGVL